MTSKHSVHILAHLTPHAHHYSEPQSEASEEYERRPLPSGEFYHVPSTPIHLLPESVAGNGRSIQMGVDLGVLVLAGVFAAIFGERGLQTYGVWGGELCRDGHIGERIRSEEGNVIRGVLQKAEWVSWLSDGLTRACTVSKVSDSWRDKGKRGRARRRRLRRLAACHRHRAKNMMQAAHTRIARQICTYTDRVYLGNLGVSELGRGRRGRMNRRLRLCRLASLRERIRLTGTGLGVDVRVVDERGTTGTCPWCVSYESRSSAVRTCPVL